MKYPHLFEPIVINSLRFPNRIEIAPMGNGVPEICEEFGQSGASVMTLGSWQIDDEYSQLMGYPDPFIKPKGQQVHGLEGPKHLKSLMTALQRYGMYASVELIHAGRYAHNFGKDDPREGHAIGPITESYRHKKGYVIEVRGMDEPMIEHVADNYAKAAVNFKNFGFDMIMLHFAHGWLPWQFLSPTFNKRTDKYGGCFENRARFPLMILKKVREAVGPDYPIEMRIGAREYRKGGFDIEECIQFVKLAEPYIDLVHVSAGLDSEPELFHHCVSKGFKPHLDKIDLVRKVKENTTLPVVLVGSVILPEEAEYAIASKACDLVALGREAMVDPDWPKKAYEGRSEDIYPCLRCASCSEQHGFGCASNPRYGRYAQVAKELEPAKVSKNVVVVGGGPGGMRAAITAAQRGHKVTLFEANERLGGQIRNFSDDPYKVDLKIYNEFLTKQVNKH
jgi:2,4-dienoyl-CoA reductase-like NADH-dependent reductase (Old Yellow Enzyme family)